MGKPLEYNATLVERVDQTEALGVFKIRTDDPAPPAGAPWFVPGQYVTLGLNNEARPELGSVQRPMSIASAPEEREHLEFYIRWVAHPESDNPFTHLLWKTAAGDRIFLRNKPTGHFTVEHCVGADDPRLAVFVAAGTGLAPFVSIVRSRVLRDPRADLSRFAVLHGASYPPDLGYRDELEGYRDRNGLRYLCSISRPHQVPDWTGDKGRVEAYFEEGRLGELEERLGLGSGALRPANATVFICGLQGTIGSTILGLAGRGFVPDNRKLRRALEVGEDVAASLFFEQYDNTPVIPVDEPEVMEPLRARLHQAIAAG